MLKLGLITLASLAAVSGESYRFVVDGEDNYIEESVDSWKKT